MNVDRPLPPALGANALVNGRHLLLDKFFGHLLGKLLRRRTKRARPKTRIVAESPAAGSHPAEQDKRAAMIASTMTAPRLSR